MLYRYEFESGCEYPHTGVILGLDDIFDEFSNELLNTILFFENNLKAPIIYHSDIERPTFYFTEKGNMKFKNCIETIKNEALKLGINIIKLELDRNLVNKIYYEDEYQVVVDNGYITKSKFINICQ